jgi:hypothetical protein
VHDRITNRLRRCDQCKEGDEQYCGAGCIFTYNSKETGTQDVMTKGGYSDHVVVNKECVPAGELCVVSESEEFQACNVFLARRTPSSLLPSLASAVQGSDADGMVLYGMPGQSKCCGCV